MWAYRCDVNTKLRLAKGSLDGALVSLMEQVERRRCSLSEGKKLTCAALARRQPCPLLCAPLSPANLEQHLTGGIPTKLLLSCCFTPPKLPLVFWSSSLCLCFASGGGGGSRHAHQPLKAKQAAVRQSRRLSLACRREQRERREVGEGALKLIY